MHEYGRSALEEIDESARERLRNMLYSDMTISDIARELGVNKGLISYVLDGNRSPTVLRALNLPVYETTPVPVCPTCGQVHKIVATCDHIRNSSPARIRKCAELTHRGDPDSPQKLDDLAELNGFDDWSHFVNHVLDLVDDGVISTFCLALPSTQASWAGGSASVQASKLAGFSRMHSGPAGSGVVVIENAPKRRVLD